jgi:hypothetical protein
LRTLRYLPIVVVCLLAASPAPARAQIYSWRDANGNLVASDHPPQAADRSFKVIGTPFRSTRPAETRYAGSYDNLIEKHAAAYAVSPKLVRAVIQVESGFNPRAVSARGAMGLMQLMPATAIEMGVRDVFDPEENIRGGVAYLRYLLNRYAGDVRLALAAYNAGPVAVDRHGYQVPAFGETQKYVSQVRSRTEAGGSAAPSAPQARAATPAATARRAAAAGPGPAPSARIYRWWERTTDGRLVQKFSDTKPASGTYDVVR